MKILTKDELINTSSEINTLPFVARKVLEMIRDENTSIADLSNAIEKDQMIAARVLKISNSALYGARQEVTSLKQAIFILGFNIMKDIVITVSTRSLYKRFGITEQMMWKHSIGTAIGARLISDGRGQDLKEVAFLGGLMHDFGKVLMNNETPEAFVDVMMKTYNEGLDSIEAERSVYGYDHTEIGSMVLQRWGFPPTIVTILSSHHLDKVTLDELSDDFVAQAIACANLANNICKVLGIGYRKKDESIVLVELPSAVYLGITQEKLDNLLKDIADTFESEVAYFQ